MNIIPKYLWKVIINRKREAQLLQALTGFSHQHLFCGTFCQIILTKFDSILTDSVSLIQILERTKYNANCFVSFWFTIHFVLELLGLVLRNTLLNFDHEYFQKTFGIVMGINSALNFGKKFIDNGFGIFEGIQNEVEY